MREWKSIALDASLWDEPTTGIGLVSRQLGQGLAQCGLVVEPIGAQKTGRFTRGRLGRTAYTLGQLPWVLRRVPSPVFHALGNFNLPLARVPGKAFVLTVHDLIPLMFPHTVSKAYYWQFRLWLARSLRLADAVICVSETTRRDLLRHFPKVASKIHVVLNGVSHVSRFLTDDAQTVEAIERLDLPKTFLLYAGSLDARKNVAVVLEAMALLAQKGRRIPMVLAGQRWFGSGPVEAMISALKAKGFDIRALGYVDEALLYGVMKRAHVFVFPSLYEGFGLPPLEAMALGVPALVSTGGSLPEVVQGGAETLSPIDAAAWALAIERVFDEPAYRNALAQKGKLRAQELTWSQAAQQTLEVYGAAIKQAGFK